MATGHLITDAQFALHGDIDLCHLDDTAGKVVTDGESELVAGEASGNLAVFDIVVVEQLFDESIGFLVGSPLVGAHLGIINGLESFGSEFDLLGDKLLAVVGVHTVGGFAVEKNEQAGDEFVLQLLALETIFLLGFGKQLFLLGAGLAVADNAGEEFLVDDHTVH